MLPKTLPIRIRGAKNFRHLTTERYRHECEIAGATRFATVIYSFLFLANANVPEERRMELTGHVTRDIHKRYTEHQLAQLQEAITLLPSL